jgi:hypothetical protein
MRILILAVCLSLVGCGGGANSDQNDKPEEDKDTVFDPLVENIDKAKAVEDQLMQSKDRTDQAIAEAEGAGDDSEDDQDD